MSPQTGLPGWCTVQIANCNSQAVRSLLVYFTSIIRSEVVVNLVVVGRAAVAAGVPSWYATGSFQLDMYFFFLFLYAIFRIYSDPFLKLFHTSTSSHTSLKTVKLMIDLSSNPSRTALPGHPLRIAEGALLTSISSSQERRCKSPGVHSVVVAGRDA